MQNIDLNDKLTQLIKLNRQYIHDANAAVVTLHTNAEALHKYLSPFLMHKKPPLAAKLKQSELPANYLEIFTQMLVNNVTLSEKLANGLEKLKKELSKI